ncbi:lipopolysaccharide biosynthesis protein [Stieleria varia]|uniref:Polysaccharide biosynthesis protein n=1 Tax=Stieleria varia TaxID=2528005 RepID=A0A5C6A078_9BACT|nr:polysaccharide biosynthesis C-terminal domain-containing protein [Stieleria varia]TWT92805.1 Polysaccharide biosynthesis protein [Stieleria varia]
MSDAPVATHREHSSSAIRFTLLRSISTTAVGVLSASVLGRGLGVAGYGRYQLVTNLAVQIGQVCEAGVGTAIVSMPADTTIGRPRVDRIVLWYLFAMLLPTAVVTCCLMFLLVDQVSWASVVACCVISLSTLVHLLEIGVLRRLRKTSLANALILLPPLLNLPIIAALWWSELLTPEAALIVLASTYVAITSVAMVWAIGLQDESPDVAERRTARLSSLKELFQRSWRSSLNRISQLLIYRFDLFLLAYFVGEESLGIYVPAVFLASQLNHLGDSVGFVLYPSVARKEMNATDVCDASRCITLFTVFAGVLIALASPWFLRAIWGDAFADSMKPLWWILPGYIVLTPARAISAYLAVVTEFRATLNASVVGLVVNCVLNTLLIPGLGVVGAAIATSVSLICISLILSISFVSKTGSKWRDIWIPRASDFRRGIAMVGFLSKGNRHDGPVSDGPVSDGAVSDGPVSDGPVDEDTASENTSR